MKSNLELTTGTRPQTLSKGEILHDYQVAYRSRQASILGRKEVMAGRAKFGIFGDGKEVAQVAMARAFQPGDFRAGYYRDQTLMFATGMQTIEQFFAQLYADTDLEREPASGGRAMSCHFGTRLLDEQGQWRNQTTQHNSTADVSPTASQMPRLVGLGYASKLYRQVPQLRSFKTFSNNGNEVAFGTIGNASCAEGLFWESVNAIGVLQVPVVLSIWDDEYGISVPNPYQITKSNLSALLKGFQYSRRLKSGFHLYTVKGWDYPALVATYLEATEIVRQHHIPAIIHVIELTQPLGHSTSGSHERYKTKQRLQWEQEFDCLKKMREWLIAEKFITENDLVQMEEELRDEVKRSLLTARKAYQAPIVAEASAVSELLEQASRTSSHKEKLKQLRLRLHRMPTPLYRTILSTLEEALLVLRDEDHSLRQGLIEKKKKLRERLQPRYSSHLYSQSPQSALNVPEVKPIYTSSSPPVNGFEILNACFDHLLTRDPSVIAFGEDVGKLGAVNQGFRGLQKKFGEWRVTDTGIREATIIGQAIGMAMRGLRPIAEIQYLDYLLYALQILSDDLATLQWRTRGGQKAPVIIRTRGHRLEGVWHSGSPMAGIMNLLRGIWVIVPRNMTQAAGFYNTLYRSDDSGLVVEVLNGYRKKERLPTNIGEFTIPLGKPEILRKGTDVTLVTYGACCEIALSAAEWLEQTGIQVEVIDIQTLVPFDRYGVILSSLQKTNRIVFLDEDVPGGATAYMMQQVLEAQKGYTWLDSPPLTITAQQHRPAYGSDGDYFSKPNREIVFEKIYRMMHEVAPYRYPLFF